MTVWNTHRAPTMPKWSSTKGTRLKHADTRLAERPFDEWVAIVQRLARSNFASGRNGKWAASPDWLVESPGNAAKVTEGNYDNREGIANPRAPVAAESVDWTTADQGEIAL